MTSTWNWESGEGLLRIDDPADWDAAYERGEPRIGTAAIGLAFNCTLAQASPRILKAMRSADRGQRGFAYTAAGHAARLNGGLTPELYAALRAEGHRGFAETAVDDTLTFVPFRELPPWFKWRKVASRVADKLQVRQQQIADAAEHLREALRGRRRSG
ncbi:hypothetical protein ABZV77_18255 [Streptomyces sp. NPDC004732]|uniref:hypothetical protein n=1 Tax=Streptomyces sp. NPDC004732 TaxID=3154290 RepID=UPI0033AA9351